MKNVHHPLLINEKKVRRWFLQFDWENCARFYSSLILIAFQSLLFKVDTDSNVFGIHHWKVLIQEIIGTSPLQELWGSYRTGMLVRFSNAGTIFRNHFQEHFWGPAPGSELKSDQQLRGGAWGPDSTDWLDLEQDVRRDPAAEEHEPSRHRHSRHTNSAGKPQTRPVLFCIL